MKKASFLLALILVLGVMVNVLRAADVEVKLDSSNGSSGLVVKSLAATGVATIDSTGRITAAGTIESISGGSFSAAGDAARAVYGIASTTGAVTNYGGYFIARGDSGRAVYAETKDGDFYGATFGIFGKCSVGNQGIGVYGTSEGIGVMGHSGTGTGVKGVSKTIAVQGDSTNSYGGYFTGPGGVYADLLNVKTNSTKTYNAFGQNNSGHLFQMGTPEWNVLISGSLEVDGRFYLDGIPVGTGLSLVRTAATSNEVMYVSSSRRFKKDIESLNVDYNKFLALRPVKFRWNEKTATPGVEDYGLIAEEVNDISPDLAFNDANNLPIGVNYQKINTMLLKVVQEQQARINNQQAEIDLLKKEVAELKNR